MHEIYPLIKQTVFPDIYREKILSLQINLGYKCNQSCLHCHVNAGPNRKEIMNLKTINQVLSFIKKSKIKKIDLTGGAPELNPHFKLLVEKANYLGCHIINRCNLTIILDLEKENLAEFFVKNNVEIIASLPCYQKNNVDAQRGKGIFEKSIKALKILNKHGYGYKKNLKLNLVYNPQDASLPPDQKLLEKQYKKELEKHLELYLITYIQ